LEYKAAPFCINWLTNWQTGDDPFYAMSQNDECKDEPGKVGGYSIYNNPFNDPELHKKFHWVKKRAEEGSSLDEKERAKREEFQASLFALAAGDMMRAYSVLLE